MQLQNPTIPNTPELSARASRICKPQQTHGWKCIELSDVMGHVMFQRTNRAEIQIFTSGFAIFSTGTLSGEHKYYQGSQKFAFTSFGAKQQQKAAIKHPDTYVHQLESSELQFILIQTRGKQQTKLVYLQECLLGIIAAL